MCRKFTSSPLQYGCKPLLWALATLVSGLVMTAYSLHLTRQRIRDSAQLEFNQYVNRIEAAIQSQFKQPLYGLRGAIGAKASMEVNSVMRRSNFHAYVASRDFATEFPGVRGLGYVERVKRSDLRRFEATEKADDAPGFAVNTHGNASDLYIVKYSELLANNRTALGMDLGAESVRREAIERAIDTGEPSLTGRTTLFQDGSKSPGFVYLVPVFPNGTKPGTPQARRSQLLGLFYSPLKVNDLLRSSIPVARGAIDFELLDGAITSSETLVFSSKNALDASSGAVTPTDFAAARAFHDARGLLIGGRLLTLHAGSSVGFDKKLDHTPLLRVRAAGGAALSLLLAAIVWLALTGRARAKTLAVAMTRDFDDLVGVQKVANEKLTHAMRENQALMTAIDQHSIVSIANPAGNITYVNDMFSRISGYRREELLGQNHRIIKSEAQSDEFWSAMWKTISSGYVWRDVVCNRAKNGSLYWVQTVISPFFDHSGAIEKYVAIRSDLTAARTAQQTLSAERERMSNIILGTRAGTWEKNVQTGELIINERWADIIGYAPQELRAINTQTWSDLCHPDDLQQANLLLSRHLEGGLGYYDCEIRMRHRDGHWVWVHTCGKTSSRTGDGKPEWMSGTHMDISEQKHAEENLRRNNTVMQSILDNIPVGLGAFDSELHLIAKNCQFQTALSLPDALFSGPTTTFERIIRFNSDHGEYGEGDHEQTIQTIIERARHPVPHQFERVRPNGTALEVRGAPIPGGGFVTTYVDISQRKRAEAEIARTTKMLQSVLDSASEVAVITTGPDRTITLFNTGAERMLGYTAAEAVGRHTSDLFIAPEELEARRAAMAVELGRPVATSEVIIAESTLGKKSEWTFRRKDGRRIVVSLVVTPLSDADGVRNGYLGISHDISTEKDYENWLHTAMQEAQAATVAKSQFLANMSHEIRTPMNAILGMLKLLQNTQLSPRQLDYASKTEGAAKSLLGLLNNILDFSKMDADKMTLDLQPFRVDSLLRDLSVILTSNLGEKPIEVLFDIDATVPAALIGDSMRLQQVLVNLSGNAIKFTTQGEVVIHIKVLARTDTQITLRFAVRDSGIGIAPENQKHIFDGFSQAEASTTRRFGGTGLGLSISKQLVTLMDGELALNSVLGQGSTFHFTITLPMTEQVQDTASTFAAHPPAHLCALMVDDNALAREVLVAMAQSLGWQVDVAASGAAAICQVEARAKGPQTPYQAIFVDWQMPDMDGWETISHLRQIGAAAHAPIMIMVTAHDREMLSQRTAREQVHLNGFLVKPITASMLRDAVIEANASGGDLPASAQLQAPKQRHLEGLRLLVVEDNLINQQVAQELLCAEGALIEIAANGQLGVNAVANAKPPFDAVLMDLQMPVMDGYAATRAIRHELGLTDLPIIAMTANVMASDREACLAAGMNDHVGKPFDLPHLIEMLRRLTKRNAGAASAPPADTADVAAALARLGGNTELYARVLQSYLSEITTLPDQLDALIHKGDWGSAARLLHTLKGLSATVGASALAAVSKEAECTLRDDASSMHLGDLTVRFRAAVVATRLLMGQILQRFAPPALQRPAAASSDALDGPRMLADLRELQALLKGSDMRAVDVHAQLRHTFTDSEPGAFKGLDDAMAAFDFPQGVLQCETLIEQNSASI